MSDFDIPVSFGYKMCWLAIKQNNPLAIAQTLGLKNVRETTWDAGVAKAYQYEERIFVSPGVGGWNFALLGHHWPETGKPQFTSNLTRLSKALDEVHYYGTHRVSDYQAWARAKQGSLIRAFGICGDVLMDVGPITLEETELGFKPVEPVNEEDSNFNELDLYENPPWFPDEEFVMQIAGRWSVDPQTLDSFEASDVQEVSGVIGEMSIGG